MAGIVGWDIGAANVKAVLWKGRTRRRRVASHAFEIWRDKNRLGAVLRAVLDAISEGAEPRRMAVTMTAELSDVFETKREGVLFVLRALRICFPGADIYVFSLTGELVPIEDAMLTPLDFAASNWLAAASWIASQINDCLYIDVGSTTTDIVPIVGRRVCVSGRSDFDRLSSGELVFTGALRTNLAAIIQSIPMAHKICRVSSEYFAISGDVHLIVGNLDPADYTCPTPDGRPPSVDSARARVARLVCADAEMLSAAEIDGIAHYICAQQIRQICQGIEQVLASHPNLRSRPAILSGSGSFLGVAAARCTGLEIGCLEANLGRDERAVVPCLAVAQLLARQLRLKSE
jgi:probable H4MPT-linked C1 transfer pathway protein